MLRITFFALVCATFFGFRNNVPLQEKQNIRSQALIVLQTKCNACHTKKKEVVFTAKNMSSYARSIQYQVFVKKRMPKGKVKLTTAEKEVLRKWIVSMGCAISF